MMMDNNDEVGLDRLVRREVQDPESHVTQNEPIVERAVLAESFSVRDAESANWVIRKIAEARAYARQVDVWANAELRRAQREEQFFLRRFGAQLESWLKSELSATKSRRKSLRLPAGSLGFRLEPAGLKITDETKLLDWCRKLLPDALRLSIEVSGSAAPDLCQWLAQNCPEARMREFVSKSVVNKSFKLFGEVPDGAMHSAATHRFYVK